MIEQSPCIGICLIEDNGLEEFCVGCGRTIKEIEYYPIGNNTEDNIKRRDINEKALNRLRND